MRLSIGSFLLFLKNFQGFSERWRLPRPNAEVMTCLMTSTASCVLNKKSGKRTCALLGAWFQITSVVSLGCGGKYTTVSANVENSDIVLRCFRSLAVAAHVYLRIDKLQWQIKTTSCSTSVAFDQTLEDSCNPIKTPLFLCSSQ